MPIDPKIQAGFVRAYRGNSAEQQEAALKAYGVPGIYFAKEGHQPENALGRLRRKGELLAIAGSLRVLSEARGDIAATVDAFHSDGYAILDIITQRRSDRDGVAMLHDAFIAFNAEDRVPDLEKAAEYGALGGKAKGVSARAGRMKIAEARPIWRNPLYATAEDALAQMWGWKKKTAYRDLGSRGTPGGRRPVDYVRQQKLKALRESDKGIIYFCRAASGGPVKIGYAGDAEKRLRALQTSHHSELTLLNAIEGSHADEQALHKRFAKYRLKGEWFKYTGPVKRYIEALPSLDGAN